MPKQSKNFVKRYHSFFLVLFFSSFLEAAEVSFQHKERTVLQVEVANTNLLRRQGLMNRQELLQDHGMLFIWTGYDQRCMWMKDTSIPITLAYLSNKGIIQEIYDMVPFSENSICSKQPARMALEVNLGWFNKNGIGIGDKLILKH